VVQRNVPAAGPTPVLITRRTPPPQQPAFHLRQQAMQPDAGRPLEPQQIQNLQSGKAAGPRRDPEYPAHAMPPAQRPMPPAQRPTPAAQPAPSARRTPAAQPAREPAKRPKP
jgi:hypothetical protein